MKAGSFLAVLICVGALAQSSDKPILEIDGTKLTMADLERRRPGVFFDARQKLFDAERAAVENFVGEYLLEKQAAKEGLTVAALLEKHVDGAIAPDPGEDSLRVYYEGLDTAESFETMRGQILQSIRERRRQRTRKAYVEQLRLNAKVKFLTPPPRLNVSLNAAPTRGGREARVVLIEYADYECPYCQQVEAALQKVRAEYPGKLQIAYKDVPLPMHPRAQKAAEASHCAGAQGKYWEFHDLLFSTKKLEISDLQQHAQTLSLDIGRFNECLNSGTQAARVKSDMSEFESAGLQGTPTFLVNGRMVSGVLSFQQFRDLIEEELAGER